MHSSVDLPLDCDLPIALIGLILFRQATPVDPYRPLYSCNEVYTENYIFTMVSIPACLTVELAGVACE